MPTLIPALPDNALYSTSLLTGIETFRNLSQRDSVSPETIASLLSLLVTALDNAADQLELNSFKAASLSTSLQSHENSNSANFTAIDNKFTQLQIDVLKANLYFFNYLWDMICSGYWQGVQWDNPVGHHNEDGTYTLNGLTNINIGQAAKIFLSWCSGKSQAGKTNLPPWRVRSGGPYKETNMSQSSCEVWWGCNSIMNGKIIGTDPGNCENSGDLREMKYVNLTNVNTGQPGCLKQLDSLLPKLEHVEFNVVEQSEIWLRSSPLLDKSTILSLFSKCPEGATIHLNKTVYNNIQGAWPEAKAMITQKNLTVTSNY